MASPTRNSQTRQRCKDAVRHSYGPETFAVNALDQEAFMLGLPRSTSDTDLVSPDARSTLTISSSHYTIGQSEDLVITWDIKEEVDAGDWIGMYLVDEALSENFLDYKNRGINGSHRGQIVWKIDSSSNFSDSETQVCFRYYHGVTGALRATTPSVTIKKGTAPVSLTAPHAFIYTYEGFWVFTGHSVSTSQITNVSTVECWFFWLHMDHGEPSCSPEGGGKTPGAVCNCNNRLPEEPGQFEFV
uniref:E3 ubiquitin-protein ligase HECW1/2 N-terminal domain-containing protein n=1 Tax=Acanthochromis polyacanthus TaxID=80966 RepID=A0A3Q1G5N5_9TELE